MKKIALVLAILLSTVMTMAQPKGKQKEKEKAPTQKELDDMMKEMRGAMDEISPEDKKMMDSMGIKMPDVKSIQKNVAGITDAQLQKAFDDENRIVPLKDVARINMALSTTLSTAEISTYINKTQQAVLLKLPTATKTKGAEIYQQLLKTKTSAANTAVGLWIDGKPTLALYVMGEACKADPANSINLNNYA